MSEICIGCGAPAALYCDFNIGAPIGSFERVGAISDDRWRACINANELPYTCDAPMCDLCGTNAGVFHVSGKQSYSQSIDHCPIHKNAAHEMSLPMTEPEALAKRSDIWAAYRRQKLTIIKEPSA